MTREELAGLFSAERFVVPMRAQTKDEVLEELLDTFVRQGLIRNRAIVLEMLHKRESLGSTGIGKGVAIPHGRSTAVPDVSIAFGRSAEPIEFDAIDGKPAQLFFMVLAPPQELNSRYLPALGRLVELVNESKGRTSLLAAKTYAEFVAVIKGEE
ncbi:MAG: PTS sugar transporter subunit IIA [candidate division KSB1 bacterium]|nr:PTS sugar transporter subunit IIA [candidate division KSB1 bacterium]